MGTSKLISDRPNFAHSVHKIAILAFLETNSVINGFERLSMALGDNYEDILDYFEGTYIGNPYFSTMRKVFTMLYF